MINWSHIKMSRFGLARGGRAYAVRQSFVARVAPGWGMDQRQDERLPQAWVATETALLGTVIFLLLQWPFERVLERKGHGITTFELAGSATAEMIVHDWGAPGVAAAQSQLVVDFFFIIAYVAVVWYAAQLASVTYGGALAAMFRIVGALAALAGVCDVVENVMLLKILSRATNSTGGWPAAWPDTAQTAAELKFVLIRLAGAFAFVGVVAVLGSRPGRRSWLAANANGFRWLLGSDDEVAPERGRPPVPIPEPLPEVAGTAISCSGGGIRSASFCLGGLQALTEAGVYQRADYITAVSGGSYIAASYAMVRGYSNRDNGETLLGTSPPVYAPGSPEEIRLRNHTRYLLPDRRVAAIGVLGVMYGLLLNLGALLILVFVVARTLGWALHEWGVLSGFSTTRASADFPDLLIAMVVGVALSSLVIYLLLDRVRDVYFRPRPGGLAGVRTWTVRLFTAALIAALLMMGAPLAISGLYNLAVSNEPNVQVAQLITAVGFATEAGCVAANKADGQGGCGIDVDTPVTNAAKEAKTVEKDSRDNQAAGLAGLLAALVGVIRLIVGRLKQPSEADDTKGSTPNVIKRLLDRARQILMPWLGTAIAAAIIAVLYLRWLEDAALEGPTFKQVSFVALAIAALAVAKLITDVNRNSNHPFYRERVASAFAVCRTSDRTADVLPYEKPARFSELPEPHGQDHPVSGPKLIVCAAANVDDQGLVPPGRNAVSFTFSADVIGVSAGYPTSAGPAPGRQATTRDFENYAGPRLLTLPAAVAVSGAAISPVMGRQTRPSVRFLLGLANVRLGLWLPNPERVQRSAPVSEPRQRFLFETPVGKFWPKLLWQWRQPGPLCLVFELLGRNSIKRRWLYVTDGGHYENLGLVEALRRRPKVVYAFDGSGDRPNNWGTLGEAVSVARVDLGVEIEIDPTVMQSDDDRLVEVAVARGTFTYPDGAKGTLWLAKLGVPKSAPWDVRSYTRRDPAFPGKTTAQQLYGDLEFESYRKIGELAGQRMVSDSRFA